MAIKKKNLFQEFIEDVKNDKQCQTILKIGSGIIMVLLLIIILKEVF